MRLLATLSDPKRLALLLDLASGAECAIPVQPEFIDVTVQGRPTCRPFGITWTSDELFICNNRQLLVFNRELQYVRTLATTLQVNTHQLAYHENRVWAISPWTNSIIGVSLSSPEDNMEFCLHKHKIQKYLPRRRSSEGADKHHFNSLLWADTHLFVAAHAFGQGSFILKYDSGTMSPICFLANVGAAIHGVALDHEELFWISSGTGHIRSSEGYCQPLLRSGYGRGFAMTSEYFIVGISEYLSRDKRWAGDSWIQVIDRDKRSLVQEFHLRDTGSINDLRIIDEYDYAHQIPPFFLHSPNNCLDGKAIGYLR